MNRLSQQRAERWKAKYGQSCNSRYLLTVRERLFLGGACCVCGAVCGAGTAGEVAGGVTGEVGVAVGVLALLLYMGVLCLN